MRNRPPIQQIATHMKTVAILSFIAVVDLFVAAATVFAGEPLLSHRAKELRIHRTSGVAAKRIDRGMPAAPGH